MAPLWKFGTFLHSCIAFMQKSAKFSLWSHEKNSCKQIVVIYSSQPDFPCQIQRNTKKKAICHFSSPGLGGPHSRPHPCTAQYGAVALFNARNFSLAGKETWIFRSLSDQTHLVDLTSFFYYSRLCRQKGLRQIIWISVLLSCADWAEWAKPMQLICKSRWQNFDGVFSSMYAKNQG